MAELIWVMDTSSLIQIKSEISRPHRERLFESLTTLVETGRLVFPRQVVAEMKRDSDSRHPDRPYEWAKSVETAACAVVPSLDEVRAILAVVPDILDAAKESGVDEADPYVLALAKVLRDTQADARVVTEETRNSPRRLSLNTACGILGIPCVPLRGFLRAEQIQVN